jgi:polyphosphate kinase
VSDEIDPVPLESKHYLNRELSWLAFNDRVLEEAMDAANPLLERLKFFGIVSSNLDEFFEVRVAGLKQQIESDPEKRGRDGRTGPETFREIVGRVHALVRRQFTCWNDQLRPELARAGIAFHSFKSLATQHQKHLETYFQAQVRPVLTPLAIDPAHPFPQVLNKSLNIIVKLEIARGATRVRHLAIVQVPRVLPHLVKLPRKDRRRDFIFLSHVIGHFLSDLFPGTRILGYWHFRVTRNSELYIDEEEIENLLQAVEQELHNRRKGDAVRLEVEKGCPVEIGKALLNTLRLSDEDLYVIDGPVNPTRLMEVTEENLPELKYPVFHPAVATPLHLAADLFEAIRGRDLLLHHPYDSYGSVLEFIEQAADDPRVLAIKQTLYRTGGDARLVQALMRAVKNGKQVSVVVELRARFDEANNIVWARQLEEAGVHVVYGLVGYKIHAKICLVVRAEKDGIRRYVHLATGNYNPTTARQYTDLALLTCRPDFGEDATNLFNLLTGICQFPGMRKLWVAPFELHPRTLALIQRETSHAQRGLPARIIAKMNSLVDPDIIDALYRASQAGVKIDLIVRGICCLRPGLAGLSENISVRSIVDRYLEHSRIVYYHNAAQPEVYLSSADWMPRNFFGRLEIAFPVEDGILRDRIEHEILSLSLADNAKARLLLADGSYQAIQPDPNQPAVRSQSEFMQLALKSARSRRKEELTPAGYPRVKLRPKPGRNQPS